MITAITVKPVSSDNPHLHLLINRLDQELMERYPPDEIFGVDFDDPSVKQVIFIVAYTGEEPAGCGGIRPLDSQTVELKRFFVDHPYRKQGVAASMLADLESRAASLGFRSVKLETGTEQPESLSFYRKHGYLEIPSYGEYADCPSSICFEKTIVAG